MPIAIEVAGLQCISCTDCESPGVKSSLAIAEKKMELRVCGEGDVRIIIFVEIALYGGQEADVSRW